LDKQLVDLPWCKEFFSINLEENFKFFYLSCGKSCLLSLFVVNLFRFVVTAITREFSLVRQETKAVSWCRILVVWSDASERKLAVVRLCGLDL